MIKQIYIHTHIYIFSLSWHNIFCILLGQIILYYEDIYSNTCLILLNRILTFSYIVLDEAYLKSLIIVNTVLTLSTIKNTNSRFKVY